MRGWGPWVNGSSLGLAVTLTVSQGSLTEGRGLWLCAWLWAGSGTLLRSFVCSFPRRLGDRQGSVWGYSCGYSRTNRYVLGLWPPGRYTGVH